MARLENRGESVRVNWHLGGSRGAARQSCTFTGPEKARQKLAEAAKALVEARAHQITRAECYDLILGKPDENANVPTLRQWVETWCDDRARMRDIQPDVLRTYQQILRHRVLPYLGHLRLTDIDQEVLRSWVAWISSSRVTIGSKNRRDGTRLLSAESIRRAHSILHTCLSAAVPKWLTVNPAAKPAGSSKHVIGLPKRGTFEGMFLTPAEIKMIREHCDEPIRDMVDVAFHTGLRLGELVVLRAKHVVFSDDGATIKVQISLKNDGTEGEPKSEKSKRDVTVGRAMRALLWARVTGKKPSALVFTSPNGKRWDENNFRERYWYRAVAAAMRCPEHPPTAPAKPARGPARALRHDEVSDCACRTRLHRRPRFHDTRHTHASTLIAEGWPVKKIQGRLGHASYQTTMNVYGHLMDSGNAEELDGVELHLGSAGLVQAPVGVSVRQRRAESVARRVRSCAGRRLHVRRSVSA